jgi:transcriptional regulator with XRE-family HTH domain
MGVESMARRSPGKTVKQRRDPEDLEIGQKIRALRVAKGVSQTTMGQALGVTFQQIQKYEKGANRVSAGRLQKIATLLDTSVTFFYDEPARKKNEPENGFALLQSKGAIRLLSAYAEISSGATKHALVLLAEALRRMDAR